MHILKSIKKRRNIETVTYIQIEEHLYRCAGCGKLIECADMAQLPFVCPHCGKSE